MTSAPGRFLLLFPVSALFWWSFEFLNRFVGNWLYTGSSYSPTTYFILASLSFSTVLPAVVSMKALVESLPQIRANFRTMPRLQPFMDKRTGMAMMTLGAASLFFIGIFPDPLFFTVWITPLFLFLGYALAAGLDHPFRPLAQGDYTPLVSWALAALCCGVFWELLNFFSLARWTYAIPYVQAGHIFEMPVLGYAGYLPFGLECAMIIHLFMPNESNPNDP